MNNLISWKAKKGRKPLLLKGARQIGKTYILEKFGREHFSQFHRFNFEKEKDLVALFEKDLDPKRIVKELSFYRKTSIDSDNDLIIFDEIQACPAALTSLKYFSEEMPQVALCAAGSLLGVYLSPVSFPVGKVEILDMFPLSFDEFLLALGENQAYEILNDEVLTTPLSTLVHERLWDLFKHYLVVGGLPEVINDYIERKENLFEAMNAVRYRQEQLIAMYNADMAKHSGKVNAMHIDRVWKSVPQQMGQSQDGSVQRYKFSGVLPGVSRYTRLVGPIDWLVAAGLLLKVPIVSQVGAPLFSHSKESFFKLYLFDVGILGAMSNILPKTLLDYDFGTYKGYIAENYVLQEFYVNGLKKLYNWQEDRHEVEFIFESEDGVIPLEVKSGFITKARSLKIFAEMYHPPYRVLFSGRKLQLKDHIRRLPLFSAGKYASTCNF